MRRVISSAELFIGMSMLPINAWVKHVFHIKQILATLIVLRAFPERLRQDLPITVSPMGILTDGTKRKTCPSNSPSHLINSGDPLN